MIVEAPALQPIRPTTTHHLDPSHEPLAPVLAAPAGPVSRLKAILLDLDSPCHVPGPR